LKDAGFDAPAPNLLALKDLFAKSGPVFSGAYNLLLVSRRIASFYPESCTLFCSDNRPVPGQHPGNNIDYVNDPKLDDLYGQGETAMETGKAESLNRQGNKIVADKVYFLPLDPQPDILLTSKKIVGTVQDNPVMGPFWTMWGWGLKK
jgi:ABC-type transport system substrate-binding protein